METQNLIAELKAKHAGDPAKLKYIEAFERALRKPLTATAEAEMLDALTSGLSYWQPNPLNAEEGKVLPVTNGFMRLLKELREYESDTFSASGAEITEAEVVMVANKLIDWLIDNRLDGVLISEKLDEVRPSESD